jgi:NADPH:quinone reductase-like Zn-dependent oxidoreductase
MFCAVLSDGRLCCPTLIEGIPMPALLPGTMLVKTSTLAINPSDYEMCAAFLTPGAVVGNDFAGQLLQS